MWSEQNGLCSAVKVTLKSAAALAAPVALQSYIDDILYAQETTLPKYTRAACAEPV